MQETYSPQKWRKICIISISAARDFASHQSAFQMITQSVSAQYAFFS